MRKITFIFAALLALSLIGVMLTGCKAENTSKIKVVTGSSLLTYIVQQVGGDHVAVINLIPPAQHPGDFSVRPGDIQTLATADLFILHGWPGEGYADKFIASANNPKLTVVRANVDGNWMIPSVQSAATDRVAGILEEVDGKNISAYSASAEEYKKRIQETETNIRERLNKANVSQVNVLASSWQADFLQWAGFNVVATYGLPESLTPQVVRNLVDQGRAGNVSLVVDNLQSGKDAGKGMAEELGAVNVNLSNFPGGFDNTETWEKAINYNVDLLLKAIAR
jgi:zinc transport system substrate-binding protein